MYYTGVFLVAALTMVVNQLYDILPDDSWYYSLLTGVASLGLIYFTIIAKFVFGKDADLDRVKTERQLLGEQVTDLQIMNEGLRVTNVMSNQVIHEGGIKSFKYDGPPTVEEIEKKEKIELLE